MSQLGLGMAALDDGPERPKRGRSVVAVGRGRRGGRSRCWPWWSLAAGLLGARGTDDYPGPGSGDVTVEIRQGRVTHGDRAALAAGRTSCKSADAFVRAAEANDNAVQIQPGTYMLPTQMSARRRRASPCSTRRTGSTENA